jgi:hypothetical protein
VLGFVSIAWAQSSDVSITSVGVQTWTSSALFGTDADLALAQRLRWTVAGDPAGTSATRMLADARFSVDPTGGDPAFEWSSVRQLGVELSRPGYALTIGRTAVFRGGPRLVDGVQALLRPSDKVDVGLWGGLAPDVFTTLPRLRPGAGPIVSYVTPRLQASVAGDVTVAVGDPARTGLDRVGVLTMVRATADRAAEASGRLDLELVGAEGTRLVDGSLFGVVTPTPFLRVDALYNAFSSYLYQNTTDLDPDLQRFAVRAGVLGTGVDAIGADTRDPRLNHVVGGAVQLQPDTDGAAPRVRVTVRNRFHPDPDNRYFRLNPQAGVVRVGDALDVLLDGNYLVIPIDPLDSLVDPQRGTQWDAGLVATFFPGEGSVGLDGSVRYVNAPDQLAGRGWYGDLYVDVVSEELDLLVTAGGSVITEPDLGDQQDTGVGAYLRVSKYLRPRK